ncbi:MAG: DNA alkylation repair protein [Fretibacterium sp.]|nr:DNA alkylation repair protein [Fretibacterium sp.]
MKEDEKSAYDVSMQEIGYIGLGDARVKDLMLDWSQRDNIWLKRTATEHQLSLIGKTDTELLGQILVK